jgi:hypothetical protein
VPSWIAGALRSLTVQERAVYLASLGAVFLAWIVTRRHAEHRPVAILLSIGLGCDAARRALYYSVFAAAYARFGSAPFEGWPRALAHVDQALFLAWPAAIVAGALASFGGREQRTRPSIAGVAVSWVIAVGALVLTYPITRGAVVARFYLGVELLALLAVIVTIGAWVRKRRSPQLHQVSVALVAGAELSALAGPWRINLFGSWPLAQAVYLVLFGVLLLLQGGSLWLFRGSSR